MLATVLKQLVRPFLFQLLQDPDLNQPILMASNNNSNTDCVKTAITKKQWQYSVLLTPCDSIHDRAKIIV